MLLLSVHDDPSQAGRYRFLAACYAHMGRLDEARETLDRIRVVTAVVMPPVDSFLRNAEHRELFLSGLGSPEPHDKAAKTLSAVGCCC